MSTESTIAQILDLEGLKCPYPLLKTRKAMAELAEGARLKVIATDPMAVVDLTHYCNEAGHDLESVIDYGVRQEFLIRKGG